MTGVSTRADDHLQDHLAHLRQRGLRESSVRRRRNLVGRLARALGGDPLHATEEQLADWYDALKLTPVARRIEVGGVHDYYRWAVETKLISENPCAALAGPGRLQADPLPPAWAEPVAAHLDYLLAAGATTHTLRLRRHWLRQLAERVGLGPWEATPMMLVSFLARSDWSPETRKSARSAVRVFYRWAEDFELVPIDPARRLPSVRVPAGVPRPAPEHVVAEALSRADSRDGLMVMLAAYAGLRCCEIARVHSCDVTGAGLRVRGKGGVTRVIPVESAALAEALRSLPEGWAFPGQIDGHLHPQSVSRVLKRLTAPAWSAHTLRHRFASRAYAGTRDLRAVQTLLGHSKPETTARYTLVPEDSLIAAVRAALIPSSVTTEHDAHLQGGIAR